MLVKLISQVQATKGKLVYEYNPFRNYRLTQNMYYFRDNFYSKRDLLLLFGTTLRPIGEGDIITDWKPYKKHQFFCPNGIEEWEDNPVAYPAGTIMDLDTEELKFDLKHPLIMEPSYSYDGSVNLIINDNYNVPKLVNSRFSAIGDNKYQIVDRKGNNDTNLYNQGNTFNFDVSLYKNYNLIPKVKFVDTFDGGSLPIGNYHFYFKYIDSDGNETDFIAESGLVSIFKGFSKRTINTGFRNESSLKSVIFNITNIDPSYNYIRVYYTRNTSDINENKVVEAKRIVKNYMIKSDLTCQIKVDGTEYSETITVDEINPRYTLAKSVKAQSICNNRMFFGNIKIWQQSYKELADLSLHFLPSLYEKSYSNGYDKTLQNSIEDTYYDPKFIYNYVGYQKDEIYRFGIVYIMEDNSLSPVFNIRGCCSDKYDYTKIDYYQKDNTSARNYIQYNEENGIILGNKLELENIYGLFTIKSSKSEYNNIFGITIKPDDTAKLKKELIKNGVKGYFFVRQPRIPQRICQAFTIGIQGKTGIPSPFCYVNGKYGLFTERFYVRSDQSIQENKAVNRLTNDYKSRIEAGQEDTRGRRGAICPDYDVNSPYLNSLFCGETFIITESTQDNYFVQDGDSRRFYLSNPIDMDQDSKTSVKILGVEDNVKQLSLNKKLYTSRSGEAKEFKWAECTVSTDEKESFNPQGAPIYDYIRGIFGPYLAIDGYNQKSRMINIYPMQSFYQSSATKYSIRSTDASPYTAISDRYSIQELSENTYYRGDSYICTFTHRLNRNFQDSTSPANSTIVDDLSFSGYLQYIHKVAKEGSVKDTEKVWGNNVLPLKNYGTPNLGDLNAIELGTWFTIPIISNFNLNIRSLDESNVDETAAMGTVRGFVPYFDTEATGSTKIPEALCINKGFQTSMSSRYNFNVPDVPAIKNDYTNRIIYSDLNIKDAFKNAFRVFQEKNYRDYPKNYGQITKLLEKSGNLICILEHGIFTLPINERIQTGEGDGGNIYINTNNVLPDTPKVLSDTVGSQWADSVIDTTTGIYGVDTVAKKIWNIGESGLEYISDFYIQEFLNNNITLSEQETDPYIGIRNVKTHYNKNKGDIMFTFYNNLEGFNETCWNICYNEVLKKWITFYSWIPSYSENISNIFFSFDRNTSKSISKLGVSNNSYLYADGITLENNIIESSDYSSQLIIKGKDYPIKEVTYSLQKDPFGNFKKFEIRKNKSNQDILALKKDISLLNICSELYQRKTKDNGRVIKPGTYDWVRNCILKDNSIIETDPLTKSKVLLDEPYNEKNITIYLNIKAEVTYILNDGATSVDTIEQSIAVIPKYNLQFLTTNFWKHGQAGLFDIKEEITPCKWYGKQHPFEFEFIVNDNPQISKIFDNLEIISNNAEPESFHYEIIGDSYDFANDKQNMFIRQEATKELYQYNGSNITFNSDYKKIKEQQRLLNNKYFDKSTILPLYYSRQDTINEIEDSYHLKDGDEVKDYSALSGAEIVMDKKKSQYKIKNHSKAVNMKNNYLHGNMRYLGDKFEVQLNPINFVQKNEPKWGTEDILRRQGLANKVPIELNQSTIPSDILDKETIDVPNTLNDRAIVVWNWEENQNKEVKAMDKYIKIRIRYTGNKLAVIYMINTLYSVIYE